MAVLVLAVVVFFDHDHGRWAVPLRLLGELVAHRDARHRLEVLTEGSVTYDKRTKLLGYARIGVTEYWVVSPDEGSVERLVLRRGKYVVEEVLMPGDVVTASRFAGLEVPVAKLFTPEAPRKSKR